ncbi:MAG: hypothetical protein ACKVXR_03395 [Planctomycetota bacterium]
MTLRGISLPSLLLLLGFACDSPPDPSEAPKASATPAAAKPPSAPKASGAAGELVFSPPSGWIVEKPTSNMRKAQYKLPRAQGDTDDASLVVFFFGSAGGGGREANLTRWAGQFEQPDGTDSSQRMQSTDRTVNGLPVTEVELSGTYVAETTPGSGERVRKENWRMLAAIVEAPAGSYYVKLVGPSETLRSWESSYKTFLDALEAAP